MTDFGNLPKWNTCFYKQKPTEWKIFFRMGLAWRICMQVLTVKVKKVLKTWSFTNEFPFTHIHSTGISPNCQQQQLIWFIRGYICTFQEMVIWHYANGEKIYLSLVFTSFWHINQTFKCFFPKLEKEQCLSYYLNDKANLRNVMVNAQSKQTSENGFKM